MAADMGNRFRILKLSAMEVVADKYGEHCSAGDLKRILRNARPAIVRSYVINGGLSERAAEKTADALCDNPLRYYGQVVSKRVADRARQGAHDRDLARRVNKSYTRRGRRQHLRG